MKKLICLLITVILIVSSFSALTIVSAATTNKVQFFVLKEGCKVPENEPSPNPKGNYISAGSGTVNELKTCTDINEIKANIISEPSFSLPDGLYVEWYVLKKENDGWHIDGCIKRSGSPITGLSLSNAYIYGDAYTPEAGSITTMRAESGISREECCALIGRILLQNNYYSDFDISNAPKFSDLSKSKWSYKHVSYIASKGAFFNNDASNADSLITRGEFAEIMACALNLQDSADLSDFRDYSSSQSNQYYSYVARLVEAGIFAGDNGKKLNISSKITRAEAVTAINRIIERDDSYELVTEDGTAYNTFYSFSDLNEDAWYYEDMVRAASAYDSNGFIDPEARNLRDSLDDISVLDV